MGRPKILDVARLQEYLSYNQITGRLVWRKKKGQNTIVDAEAGHYTKAGYRLVGFDMYQFFEHRVVWAVFYGEQPPQFIDHIDGDRGNNRIENLRAATRELNNQNLRRPKTHNTSGFLGVSLAGTTWQARIRINGKPTYLGRFKTKEAAYEAYLTSKRSHHSGCTL
jgi:hypothetical protein